MLFSLLLWWGGAAGTPPTFLVEWARNSNVVLGYSREQATPTLVVVVPPVAVGFAFNRSAFANAFA